MLHFKDLFDEADKVVEKISQISKQEGNADFVLDENQVLDNVKFVVIDAIEKRSDHEHFPVASVMYEILVSIWNRTDGLKRQVYHLIDGHFGNVFSGKENIMLQRAFTPDTQIPLMEDHFIDAFKDMISNNAGSPFNQSESEKCFTARLGSFCRLYNHVFPDHNIFQTVIPLNDRPLFQYICVLFKVIENNAAPKISLAELVNQMADSQYLQAAGNLPLPTRRDQVSAFIQFTANLYRWLDAILKTFLEGWRSKDAPPATGEAGKIKVDDVYLDVAILCVNPNDLATVAGNVVDAENAFFYQTADLKNTVFPNEENANQDVNGEYYSLRYVSPFFGVRCVYFLPTEENNAFVLPDRAQGYYEGRKPSAFICVLDAPHLNNLREKINVIQNALNAFPVDTAAKEEMPVYFLFNGFHNQPECWKAVNAFLDETYDNRGFHNLNVRLDSRNVWKDLTEDLELRTRNQRIDYVKDYFLYNSRFDDETRRSKLRENLLKYENIYLHIERLVELLKSINNTFSVHSQEQDLNRNNEQKRLYKRMEHYETLNTPEEIFKNAAETAIDYSSSERTFLEKTSERYEFLCHALERSLALAKSLHQMFKNDIYEEKNVDGPDNYTFWGGFSLKGRVLVPDEAVPGEQGHEAPGELINLDEQARPEEGDAPMRADVLAQQRRERICVWDDFQLNHSLGERNEAKCELFRTLYEDENGQGKFVEEIFLDMEKKLQSLGDCYQNPDALKQALKAKAAGVTADYLKYLLEHQSLFNYTLQPLENNLLVPLTKCLGSFFARNWKTWLNKYASLSEVFTDYHNPWSLTVKRWKVEKLRDTVKMWTTFSEQQDHNQDEWTRFQNAVNGMPDANNLKKWLIFQFLLSLLERVKTLQILRCVPPLPNVHNVLENWEKFLKCCIAGTVENGQDRHEWAENWENGRGPALRLTGQAGNEVVQDWELVLRSMKDYDCFIEKSVQQIREAGTGGH
jgi:hypothetical protein